MRQNFQKLLKKYYVLVLAGLGVIVFLGLISVYILSRGGGAREDDPNSRFASTATLEVTETETVGDEAQRYFDYVWYEDDYVRFEYPKGWEVKWSTLEGFDSLSRLSISDGHSSLILDKWCGHFGLDRLFLYDQEEPKKWYILPGGEETNLFKEPFIRNSNFKDDIFLFIFEPKSFGDSRFQEISSSSNVYLANQMDNDTYEIREPYLNLDLYNCEADPYYKDMVPLYGKGNNGVRIKADCTIENENDANQCAEFVSSFFESVERKGQSKIVASTLENENDSTISSENYQLNGECDGLVSVLEEKKLLSRDDKGLFSGASEEVFECWLSRKSEPNKKLQTVKRFVTNNHRFDLDRESIGLTQNSFDYSLWGKVMLGKETGEGVYLVEDHYDLGDTATLSLYEYNYKEAKLIHINDYQFSTYWLMEGAYDDKYNLVPRERFIDQLCRLNVSAMAYGSTEKECVEWIGTQYDQAYEYYQVLENYLGK